MGVSTRRAGAATAEPFTILIAANVAIEAPFNTGQFLRDPIMSDPNGFNSSVDYIENALFGNLPNQAESLLGDPALAPNVRLLTWFDAATPTTATHSFVGQDSGSLLIMARRMAITTFLQANNLIADVVFAVTGSATHSRASAWYTSDDDAGPGVPFQLDGATFHHRKRYQIPGTVAIHRSANSLTAAHEFSHAISSYTNGRIVDLYSDQQIPNLNTKLRPVISPFATYANTAFAPGARAAAGGYPAGWRSYHCDLSAPAFPALMDNYWLGAPPERCENDLITRQFIKDRVAAKMSR